MTEPEENEWARFRKAYQQALIDRGSPSTLMAFQQSTESSIGQEQTIAKTIAIPFRMIRDGIGIPSKNETSQIPFARSDKDRTDTDTYRTKRTSTVRLWFCNACGAENPSGALKDERTYSCQSCGKDVRKTISQNAETIFGPWEP